MTPVEILKAARDRIADPDKWTTQELARNASGEAVRAGSSDAVCWCAYGAVIAEGYNYRDAKVDAEECLEGAAVELHSGDDVVGVNDHLGHNAVMAMFDLAIAKAEELE